MKRSTAHNTAEAVKQCCGGRARRCTEAGAEPCLPGLRVVQVTLAMIAAAREGRTVQIEPLAV